MDWEPVHTGNFWFTHHASKDKGSKALSYKGYSDFSSFWKAFTLLSCFLLHFIGLAVNTFCCK